MTKRGPKGPRPGSASTLYRTLIAEGKTDEQVWKTVKRKFPHLKTNRTKWFRWRLRYPEEPKQVRPLATWGMK